MLFAKESVIKGKASRILDRLSSPFVLFKHYLRRIALQAP